MTPIHPPSTFVWLFCLSLGIIAAPMIGAGDNWPQFLGPHANGISDETSLLDRWLANGPPILWEKSIGTGYDVPSVSDRRLVLGLRIVSRQNGRGRPFQTLPPPFRVQPSPHLGLNERDQNWVQETI